MTPNDEYRVYIDWVMKKARRKSKKLQISNDEQADWCLRSMGDLESRVSARTEFVQLQMARLQSWLARRNKGDTKKLSTLHGILRNYALSLYDSGKLTVGETHELPHGELQLTPGENTLTPSVMIRPNNTTMH